LKRKPAKRAHRENNPPQHINEKVFSGIAGQKNKKEAQDRDVLGPAGLFSRPDLAIPRWVAPQQSPTPFRQATLSLSKNAALKTGGISKPAKRAHRLLGLIKLAKPISPALAKDF
jgi:hypothetical protein